MTRTCRAARAVRASSCRSGSAPLLPRPLVREIRAVRGLRPVCDCCKAGGVKVTVGLRSRARRGAAARLARVLKRRRGARRPTRRSARSRARAGVRARVRRRADVRALDRGVGLVLRRLGGTARSWRTDRMATVVYPGTDRLRPEAAAAAKHYGVTVAVCPANRVGHDLRGHHRRRRDPRPATTSRNRAAD